jgi:Ca-activated chloride channel family protein
VVAVARAGRGAPAGPHLARAALRFVVLMLTIAGLAGLLVGFARPEMPQMTTTDRATVVIMLDASTTMRATDVDPTRFEAARAIAERAISAVPERLQVAVVAYARTAYIVQPPTHDHGAGIAALRRVRTTEDAAPGEGLTVALAAVPPLQETAPGAAGPPGAAGAAGAPSVPGAAGAAGAARVPALVVWIGSGVATTGRPIAEPAASARAAGIPVYAVPVGPAPGAELRAPFDAPAMQALAAATGARALRSPATRDWRAVFAEVSAATKVERKPQEVGHFVGAGALAVLGVTAAVSLATSRRLL